MYRLLTFLSLLPFPSNSRIIPLGKKKSREKPSPPTESKTSLLPLSHDERFRSHKALMLLQQASRVERFKTHSDGPLFFPFFRLSWGLKRGKDLKGVFPTTFSSSSCVRMLLLLRKEPRAGNKKLFSLPQPSWQKRSFFIRGVDEDEKKNKKGQ